MYFHDERDMWTDHDWARFRMENPRPPGPGRIIEIDSRVLAIDITGVPFDDSQGVGWNRRIDFVNFPDGILTQFWEILKDKPAPALWVGPYSPASFTAKDHRELCERRDVKVTCVTDNTLPTYAHTGKPKAVNAIGHLFTCHEDPSGAAWRYEGTCCPRGTLPNSVPPEHGENADQQCPGTPPSAEGAHLILWLFALAFDPTPSQKGSSIMKSSQVDLPALPGPSSGGSRRRDGGCAGRGG